MPQSFSLMPLLVATLITVTQPALAAVFTYKDGYGVTHGVDSIDQIPEAYRVRAIKTGEGSSAPLPKAATSASAEATAKGSGTGTSTSTSTSTSVASVSSSAALEALEPEEKAKFLKVEEECRRKALGEVQAMQMMAAQAGDEDASKGVSDGLKRKGNSRFRNCIDAGLGKEKGDLVKPLYDL